MLPVLAEHFTCYLMSTRGRGLSGKHPDQSRAPFEDVAARFARASENRSESWATPVVPCGHLAASRWPLTLCALSRSMTAAALDRPVAGEAAIEAIARTAADGRLAEAALMCDRRSQSSPRPRSVPCSPHPRWPHSPCLCNGRTAGASGTEPALRHSSRREADDAVMLVQGSRTRATLKDAVRHGA